MKFFLVYFGLSLTSVLFFTGAPLWLTLLVLLFTLEISIQIWLK